MQTSKQGGQAGEWSCDVSDHQAHLNKMSADEHSNEHKSIKFIPGNLE